MSRDWGRRWRTVLISECTAGSERMGGQLDTSCNDTSLPSKRCSLGVANSVGEGDQGPEDRWKSRVECMRLLS